MRQVLSRAEVKVALSNPAFLHALNHANFNVAINSPALGAALYPLESHLSAPGGPPWSPDVALYMRVG